MRHYTSLTLRYHSADKAYKSHNKGLRAALLKKIIFAIIGCSLLLALSGALTYAVTVGSIKVGLISKGDPGKSEACERYGLPFYEKYNQELASNDYLPFAIASLNVYKYKFNSEFTLSYYASQFQLIADADHINPDMDIHFRDGAEPLAIAAFRGTRFTNFWDWYANFSWFTGFLPIDNAYDSARRDFAKARDRVQQLAPGKTIRWIATGHSLGGGLAQHIAFGFPCVSAVVLDTSFVTNKHVYDAPHDAAVIVHLHDKRDELTKLHHWIFKEQDTPTYRWYPLKLVPKGTMGHDSLRFVVGMSGMATNCQVRSDCQIPKTDLRAANIYCPTYGRKDEVCQPILKKLGLLNK
ncbi:hypothetical protein [Bosea sp. 685]|uniref:hypothetical protein n=1 Tax=Bosea sp. 685 TaxID=3080057 RepID=UPI002892F132|nr:hypothetical protein [Bosea sp. 685]WNJ88849.1 hypothetical protein RMR04_20855 [Bosea sp. 685]